MFLTYTTSALSDAAAVRGAALELPYYNNYIHPETFSPDGREKGWQFRWATESDIYMVSASITETSGTLKTAIDEVISLVDADEDLGTVDNYMAYCQYYKSSEDLPVPHYDLATGFDPIYNPDLMAIVYLSDVSGAMEFWSDIIPGSTTSTFVVEKALSNNALVMYDNTHASRVKPAAFGTDETDSGLMLSIYMKTS